MSRETFDVDLSALLSVFGGHLYSTPAVFVRELVQNALDAITLRRRREPDFAAQVEVFVESGSSTLRFVDNGVGLTADGLREHLSRVGGSSKREQDRDDVIGQFGIGLLSGFLVADELVVHTCAAQGPPLAWRARADGSYTIGEGTRRVQGTEVQVQLRPKMADYARPERIRELLDTYVPHVRVPVTLIVDGNRSETITRPGPWELDADERERAIAQLAGEAPLWHFEVEHGADRGLIWVRGRAVALAKPVLWLYHHGVLVDAAASGLLPRWAGFMGGVLEASSLAPTASRESFVHDANWEALAAHLSKTLVATLAGLPNADPQLLATLLDIHRAHLLAACIDDEALLAAFGGQIPVETNDGLTTLDEQRGGQSLLYTTSPAEFGTLAPIISARGGTLVNACHVHEQEFLQAWQRVCAQAPVTELELKDVRGWVDSAPEQRARFAELLAACGEVLHPLDVEPELSSFAPSEVPVLLLGDESRLRERARELMQSGNALQQSLVRGLNVVRHGARTPLLLNAENRLIAALPELVPAEVGARIVRVLYAQVAQRLRRVPSLPESRMLADDLLHVLRAPTQPIDHGKHTHH